MLIFLALLSPLMLCRRAGWRVPLMCVMYAIGAVTFVDSLWAGARIALAFFPTDFTNADLNSCFALKAYACREDIVLRRSQNVSNFVVTVETLWCSIILIALLAKNWTAPLLPTAAAVVLARRGSTICAARCWPSRTANMTTKSMPSAS
jgi:hypothetical protein